MENTKIERSVTPRELKSRLPITEKANDNVINTRKQIVNILEGRDFRKIFIVGPCSVHNYNESIEYARKLRELSERVGDKILLLMRVYLEKPRSTIGWKGFVNDPDLDGSFKIEKGLELSRKLLIEINEMGVGVATEFLDFLVYPYTSDLVSWGAIGARTVESQVHRQIVSGLPMPIGFKNATSGNIDLAINAIISSKNPHSFIGIDEEGHVAKITTKGNKDCMLILRGGVTGPNYEDDFVREASKRLIENGTSGRLIVDCSHGNSDKDYKRQPDVFRDLVNQMKRNKLLIGLMIESYLAEGNQRIPEDLGDLKKGVSITDACVGWGETENLILWAYDEL